MVNKVNGISYPPPAVMAVDEVHILPAEPVDIGDGVVRDLVAVALSWEGRVFARIAVAPELARQFPAFLTLLARAGEVDDGESSAPPEPEPPALVLDDDDGTEAANGDEARTNQD